MVGCVVAENALRRSGCGAEVEVEGTGRKAGSDIVGYVECWIGRASVAGCAIGRV